VLGYVFQNFLTQVHFLCQYKQLANLINWCRSWSLNVDHHLNVVGCLKRTIFRLEIFESVIKPYVLNEYVSHFKRNNTKIKKHISTHPDILFWTQSFTHATDIRAIVRLSAKFKTVNQNVFVIKDIMEMESIAKVSNSSFSVSYFRLHQSWDWRKQVPLSCIKAIVWNCLFFLS